MFRRFRQRLFGRGERETHVSVVPTRLPATPSLNLDLSTENANQTPFETAQAIWTSIRHTVSVFHAAGAEEALVREIRLRKSPIGKYRDDSVFTVSNNISRHALNFAYKPEFGNNFPQDALAEASSMATLVTFWAMDTLTDKLQDQSLAFLDNQNPRYANLFYRSNDSERYAFHPEEADKKIPEMFTFLIPIIQNKQGNLDMVRGLFGPETQTGRIIEEAKAHPELSAAFDEVINYSIGAATMEYAYAIQDELQRAGNSGPRRDQ